MNLMVASSAAAAAKVAIDRSQLDVETELITPALSSGAAIEALEAMPSVDQLMPVLDVDEIGPGVADEDQMHPRYRNWEPPTESVSAVLTPSSATTREAKRDAVARALAAEPTASDRAIARTVGVDHKTVGKLRGIPQSHGDIPTDDEGDRT
jgi:hypothetical protein